eukprot:GHVR01069204.1.p1 GENE.GHVR01069204.1~~GHVR01069204.1.p1  ORF type:complete len:232 (-),score=45.62 GHVR01069204.1:284-979(-)
MTDAESPKTDNDTGAAVPPDAPVSKRFFIISIVLLIVLCIFVNGGMLLVYIKYYSHGGKDSHVAVKNDAAQKNDPVINKSSNNKPVDTDVVVVTDDVCTDIFNIVKRSPTLDKPYSKEDAANEHVKSFYNECENLGDGDTHLNKLKCSIKMCMDENSVFDKASLDWYMQKSPLEYPIKNKIASMLSYYGIESFFTLTIDKNPHPDTNTYAAFINTAPLPGKWIDILSNPDK